MLVCRSFGCRLSFFNEQYVKIIDILIENCDADLASINDYDSIDVSGNVNNVSCNFPNINVHDNVVDNLGVNATLSENLVNNPVSLSGKKPGHFVRIPMHSTMLWAGLHLQVSVILISIVLVLVLYT
jgi:hypothetical protein